MIATDLRNDQLDAYTNQRRRPEVVRQAGPVLTIKTEVQCGATREVIYIVLIDLVGSVRRARIEGPESSLLPKPYFSIVFNGRLGVWDIPIESISANCPSTR